MSKDTRLDLEHTTLALQQAYSQWHETDLNKYADEICRLSVHYKQLTGEEYKPNFNEYNVVGIIRE